MSSGRQKFPNPMLFVGRRKEIDQLSDLINDDACRLITIVGPGGSGKTRLALELQQYVEAQFDDGIYFVSLQPLNSSDNITPAIAETLGCPIQGQETPLHQIIHCLQDKHLLLILDNFEHLLNTHSAQLISRFLGSVPRLKILITSRETLNLREECLLRIHGMQVPENETISGLQDYDAIRLFTEYARRVQPDFSLDEQAFYVVSICRQVEGLPLAIELAASWLRYMSTEQIADEIARDITALATTLRNIPERHRSMQAVFDHSWHMLSDEEQNTLGKLTVFRGDFGRKAALYIAEADLPILTSLVDKSLLQSTIDGRYRMHELLRQYSEAKLLQSTRAFVQQQFCDYYAEFLHSRMDQIVGGRQIEVAQEIDVELANIRVAWKQAITQKNAMFFAKAAQTLSLFLQFTSRFVEGADLFGKATQALQNLQLEMSGRALLYLQVDWGWFDIRLGHLEQAAKVLSECLEVYHQLDISPLRGHGSDPRLPLGIIAIIRGNYQQALAYAEQALELAETQYANQYFAHYIRANALFAQGNLQQAKSEGERAYFLAQAQHDTWFMAYCLNVRGDIARALSSYEEAKRHYLESYRIREAFEDPEGMAVALNHLGQIALLQSDANQAERYYRQSRALYQKLYDQGGLAEVQIGLGALALEKQDYTQAQKHLREALIIANEIRHLGLIFTTLNHIAHLFQQTGREAESHNLLILVRDHPASSQEAIAKAQKLLRAEGKDQHRSTGTPNWEKIVDNLIASLGEPEQLPQLPSQEALIEPLTDREFEVLKLLAEGLTNQDIAKELTIVVGTVKAHNHSIYGKLGVRNRTEAVACAHELHLI